MKYLEVKSLVFGLTNKQDNGLSQKFPEEKCISNEEVRSQARDWIMEVGKFMFNIYFI